VEYTSGLLSRRMCGTSAVFLLLVSIGKSLMVAIKELPERDNKSWAQADALVRRHLLPWWGKLKAADVKRLDRVPLSYPSIWEKMRRNEFPRSRDVGGRSFWVEAEIDEWIASLPGSPHARPRHDPRHLARHR
jgi:predicted DNA-binding transcriptional regulator AlpA